DRLTRSANSAIGQQKNHTCNFTIDPALARAIRDDHKRIWELKYELDTSKKRPTPLETEEERMLLARIAERATTISCPADYGAKEAYDDEERLEKRFLKRWPRGTLNDAEDAEETQLRARVEAFNHSPEGCARTRIMNLEMRSFFGLSSADQEELDRLRALYP